MTVVVLDSLRSVTAVDNGPTSLITVASAGVQGPQGTPTTVNGHSGASITLTAADVNAVPTSAEGAANGVATLDSSSLVPIAQIPVTALAADFVDLSTNQTVATGIKTFSLSPVVPTPISATQAANKQYVDSVAQGLNVKTSSTCATTAALPANTYNNGTSGVGATLTGTATGTLTIDGHLVALNDTVLVQNEGTQANNGLYLCTTAGATGVAYVLTRSTNMNTPAEIPGAFSFVETGTVNAGAGFVVAGSGPYTIGTTAIVWTQFSGAGEITAGTGLTKSGNTISLSTPVTIANGGTGQSTQTTAFDALSPNTTLGDLSYRGSSNNVRLAGSTSATKQFLTQTGTGSVSAAPEWGTIQVADVPTLNQNTTGTAANVTGTVAIANGGTGSTTQNFVDLTTAQTVAGNKTLSNLLTVNNRVRAANTGSNSGSGGFMGEVAGAKPASGTFVTGDFVVDNVLGIVWTCTNGGTPGTWVACQTFVCTSTTHPTTPFTGLEIFETDTLLTAIYTGSGYYYPPQLVATQTVSGSSTGTLTFTGLPQVFKTLRVVISAKTQVASQADTIRYTINNVTSASYDYQLQSITNTGAPTNQNTSGQTTGVAGLAWGNTFTTPGMGVTEALFVNYSTTTFGKGCTFISWTGDGGSAYEAATGGSALATTATTAAITRLDFITAGANYVSGSKIDIYGM